MTYTAVGKRAHFDRLGLFFRGLSWFWVVASVGFNTIAVKIKVYYSFEIE